MRVCFTSDLHGSERHFAQLDQLVRSERPGLLILGGDLFRDVDRAAPVQPQLMQMRDELRQRIARWQAEIAGLTVACVLGNHELAPMRDLMRAEHEAGQIVLLDHERPWTFAGHRWLGYADTPPTPHWAKDLERLDTRQTPLPDFPGVAWDEATASLQPVEIGGFFGGRETVAQQLDRMPCVDGPWVLVAHAPPYDTTLDRLPTVTVPIGSRAVRYLIEHRQPLLSLHGHVHESPDVTGHYVDRLGQTLCVNPGQGRDMLHAVVFGLEAPGETIRHTVYG